MKVTGSETPGLAAGSTLKQFVVVECLGIDQHAALYRAESADTGHPVLLMEYLPVGLVERADGVLRTLAGQSAVYERAMASYAKRLREAALVGHHALPVFDEIWREADALIAVGPWQAGKNLLAELEQHRSAPDPQLLCQWARTLCDALTALHRNQLLHGNLAAHMLRVRQTGELMLPLIAGDSFTKELPPWVAPEQHPMNPKPGPVGPWSDIYQLSAALYQLMTGHAPPTVLRRWEGAALEHLTDDLAQSAQLPPGLVVATRKGLAMHHDTRPQSVDAWLDLAGLHDRRHQQRYEPGLELPAAKPGASPSVMSGRSVAMAMAAEAAQTAPPPRSPHSTLNAPEDSHWNRTSTSDYGTADQPDPADLMQATTEDTPAWVWLCLAVAVGAFLTILVRSTA